MADAEREDEAVERDVAPRIDGIEELADTGLAPALAVLQPLERPLVARFKREDVIRRLDQAVGVELLDDLVAQSFDVEGIARGEMLQPLDACAGQISPPVQRRTASVLPVVRSSRSAWLPQAGQIVGKT